MVQFRTRGLQQRGWGLHRLATPASMEPLLLSSLAEWGRGPVVIPGRLDIAVVRRGTMFSLFHVEQRGRGEATDHPAGVLRRSP